MEAEEVVFGVITDFTDKKKRPRDRARANAVGRRVTASLLRFSGPSEYQTKVHRSAYLVFRQRTFGLRPQVAALPDHAAKRVADFMAEVLDYVLDEHGFVTLPRKVHR